MRKLAVLLVGALIAVVALAGCKHTGGCGQQGPTEGAICQ